MNRKFRKLPSVIVLTIMVCAMIAGCAKSNERSGGVVGYISPVADPKISIGFKSETAIFDVSDVTLDFYCGTERVRGAVAAENDYSGLPTVTYMFFVTGKDDLTPDNALYDLIDGDEDVCVCKRIYSTDEMPFYVCNSVKRQYLDYPVGTSFDVLEGLWANGAGFHFLSNCGEPGIVVPDVSYKFTIPEKMFSADDGCILFVIVSFLAEDLTPEQIESKVIKNNVSCAGDVLEYGMARIYYSKIGYDVTLNSRS